MKKLTKEEYQRWTRWHKQGGTSINRCKLNQLCHSTANTLNHELAKFLDLFELQSEGHNVITEAVENKTGLRRDLVDLTTDEIIEYETDPKRAERHGKGIKVVLVDDQYIITKIGVMQ